MSQIYIIFLVISVVATTSAFRSFVRRLPTQHSLLMQLNEKYRTIHEGKYVKLSFEVAGKSMSFETGKIGRQASGAVVATSADTMIYSTVCNERDPTPVDFTPLRVDYFARYSAVGQTIGTKFTNFEVINIIRTILKDSSFTIY